MSSVPSSVLSTVIGELYHILLALVGGARYGIKIRLPHALLTTALFRKELSAKDKIRSIVRLTVEHATNLAAFASIYKTLLAILKWTSLHIKGISSENDRTRNVGVVKAIFRTLMLIVVNGPFRDEAVLQRLAVSSPSSPPGRAESSYHAFLAGAVGGYFVWGRYSSLNYQIVLYLTSRVLVALGKRILLDYPDFIQNWFNPERRNKVYSLSAAAVWGIVLMLFEECPEVLHPSLKSSMDEIYRYRSKTNDTSTAGINTHQRQTKSNYA